ncbi:thiol reductase thioredoxin [Halorubrum sp. 48-1-W]|uniref:thioredoxin family protein n=1 Tax=Halorubrum sp. 48-1-W TaxID=2249761 RepID=UPI000DCB9CFB|nr:thioredoxin family protein [Halorubrum sp. 48-1-W]RAW44782.1 thiol reductase thioredoxin [Halorubrum sp. 48-1-W]
MSESERSERERIRERKRRELLERIESEANGGSDVDGAVGSDVDGAGGSDGGSETPAEPVEVESVEEFQQLVGQHDVVLVDCYADWCGPCQLMEPTVESLAVETDAVVAKVDVDGLPALAQQLGARGVPTFLVYANGEPVERFVGAQDRTTLESAIANNAA